MHFTRSLLLALASALAAYAQTGPNPFTLDPGFAVTAGESVELTWEPTTEGTVTLRLRNGASSDLNVVEPIAEEIPNSGSYTWTPDSDTVRGSDYTVEIIDDQNPDDVNYTAYFVLESDNTVASITTSDVSSATSVSPLPTTLSTITPSTTGSMTSDASESTTETTETTTVSDSSSSSATSTSTATTTSDSDLQASAATTTADGAGARATAMTGMLGAVALGVLAL